MYKRDNAMKSKRVFGVLCLLSAMLMSISNVSAAQKAEPGIPLASAGENFIAEYSNMLTALKAEIVKSVPGIDEKESAGFLEVYASESGTKSAEIELAKGKNVLHFTRDIPNYGLTIKHFTLTPAM
jgi:hypothetical protein